MTSPDANRRHGEAGYKGRPRTPEYRAWINVIGRCEDERSKSYKNYGARGIRVCDRWRASYEAFLADMGRRPSASHSIERNDNDGPYSPENCRWATKMEQSQNRRGNYTLTLDGETVCLAEACRRLGLQYKTIHNRILAVGLPPGEALNAELRNHVFVTLHGRKMVLAEACKQTGVAYQTAWRRVRVLGWSPEDAVSRSAAHSSRTRRTPAAA
jgi:hypothetical protein